MLNLTYSKEDNVGDRCAAVQLYYPKLAANIADLKAWKPTAANVIFGGGMLLKFIRRYKVLDYMRGLKIGWGVGHAKSIKETFHYVDEPFLKKFDLLGVRDYIPGLRYVPCPTCKSELFDRRYAIKHPVVAYTNALSGKMRPKGMPIMTNASARTMADAIEFLGSGETILTSSYHGAYWGMLLNRRVVVVPFNSKFFGFKYQPTIVEDPDKWCRVAGRPAPDTYLEECRQLNDEFYSDVLALLDRQERP
jgi:hypothetical protein